MTSVQINTSETINQINENNDSKQNLGDGDKTIHRQEKNGIDLLCCSEFSNSESFDSPSFDKLNTKHSVVDEMTEYDNAKNQYKNEAFLKKYKELTEQTKEEVQSRSNRLELSSEKKLEEFTDVPKINYEDMYKDDICTFFIGSVTLIGLFIVYKMIER
jgi:hypothetical protein